MDSTTNALKDLTVSNSPSNNANTASTVRTAPGKAVNSSPAPSVPFPSLDMDNDGQSAKIPNPIQVTHMDERDSFKKKNPLYALAPRPGFVKPDKSYEVYTNHLSMDLNSSKHGKLFIYEVSPIADTLTKPKKRVLMESFIHKCALL